MNEIKFRTPVVRLFITIIQFYLITFLSCYVHYLITLIRPSTVKSLSTDSGGMVLVLNECVQEMRVMSHSIKKCFLHN